MQSPVVFWSGVEFTDPSNPWPRPNFRGHRIGSPSQKDEDRLRKSREWGAGKRKRPRISLRLEKIQGHREPEDPSPGSARKGA